MSNSFGSCSVLRVANREFNIYRLDSLEKQGLKMARLPSSLPWRELRSSASEMMPLLGCLAGAATAARVFTDSGLNGTGAAVGALDDVLPLALLTSAGFAAGASERVPEVALP
jgi:hypothetical protein